VVEDSLAGERQPRSQPDAVFERARAHFHDQELIALVFTLTTINAWNRLAITMRTEVGTYQSKART
jgi:alkylhydroperoxidase family enzyme